MKVDTAHLTNKKSVFFVFILNILVYLTLIKFLDDTWRQNKPCASVYSNIGDISQSYV